MADLPSYVAECVKEMQTLDLDEYGFNLVRTYYDEALWQSFRRDFDAAMEGTAEYAAIKPLNIVTRFHDDADFAGLGPAGVSNAFQIFCLDSDEEGEDDDHDHDHDEVDDGPSHEMGPGVIQSVCLMADEASMRSFKSTPYVIAVDAMLHTGVDLGYPGYFKVAIDCLMPKFYAAIGHFDLAKVAASVDDDGIWKGMKNDEDKTL